MNKRQKKKKLKKILLLNDPYIRMFGTTQIYELQERGFYRVTSFDGYYSGTEIYKVTKMGYLYYVPWMLIKNFNFEKKGVIYRHKWA